METIKLHINNTFFINNNYTFDKKVQFSIIITSLLYNLQFNFKLNVVEEKKEHFFLSL